MAGNRRVSKPGFFNFQETPQIDGSGFLKYTARNLPNSRLWFLSASFYDPAWYCITYVQRKRSWGCPWQSHLWELMYVVFWKNKMIKKPSQIPGNTLYDALLIIHIQNFAADIARCSARPPAGGLAKSKSALCAIFFWRESRKKIDAHLPIIVARNAARRGPPALVCRVGILLLAACVFFSVNSLLA